MIRFSSLGDCVLISGVIDELYRLSGKRPLLLCIKEQFAGLYEDDPRVVLFPLRTRTQHSGIVGLWQYTKALKTARVTEILDLHGTLRARLLRLLTLVAMPGRRWRSLKKSSIGRRLALWTRRFPQPPIHLTQRYRAAALGVEARAVEPIVPLLMAPVLPRHFDRNKAPIALVPGAAWATKQWPVGHFRGLAERLLAAEIPVTVIGGDLEAHLSAAFSGLSVTLLLGNRPLYELRRVLAGMRAVVANDTGLMHMADALGVPVVALFGPTAPVLGFTPQGEHSRSLWVGTPCSPCTLHGHKHCPRGHWRCMRELNIETVAQAVQECIGIELAAQQ